MRRFLSSPRGGLFLATVVLLLFGFAGMFQRIMQLFAAPDEDLSYGGFVPVFSLFVLWTRRRELVAAATAGAPSWGGLAACLPCFVLAVLGTRGLQVRFEQLGFIGLCITVPWAFFGRAVAKICVFPALYLLFTIPLATFLDVVTIHLRLLACSTALAVLNGIGVEVVQQGTAILSQGAHPFSIDVAEPCSGLRSLFALMALTAAYAWFTQSGFLRRALLFACSIPLAVLGNVMRIVTICLVAAGADPDFATGFYHDYSGYIVFLVAILCMVGCGELIGRMPVRAHRAAAPDVSPASSPSTGRRGIVVPIVAFLLLGALVLFQATTPKSTLAEAPVISLPRNVPGYVDDGLRFCHNETCLQCVTLTELKGATACPTCGGELFHVSLGEKTLLPADTKLEKRTYQNAHGQHFLVSVVIGGASKSSIHRPELCLPTQGFLMADPANFAVDGIPFHAIHLANKQMPTSMLVYTFFNQAGMRTASHTRRIFQDVLDRSFLNRIDRWVMVSVQASSATGFTLDRVADRQALEAFLSQVMKGLR